MSADIPKLVPKTGSPDAAYLKLKIDEDFDLLKHAVKKADELGLKLHQVRTNRDGRIEDATFEGCS